MTFKPLFRPALWLVTLGNTSVLTLRADHSPRAVLPDAVVDLRTTEGVARVNAQWRYSDTTIREIEHQDVGADLKTSGPKNHTFDFSPDARAANFDDSKWEIFPPILSKTAAVTDGSLLTGTASTSPSRKRL